jgi:TolA-binding protein
VEDLVEVAFDAKTGEIAGPIRINGNYHIIRITEAAHRPTASIGQLKPNISKELTRQRRAEKEKVLIDKLKAKFPVEIDMEAITGEPTKTARELFEEAQTAADPETRLQAYQQIVEDYPKSRDAERALFMVGYIYANDLKEYRLAEETFRDLLEDYTNGDYADDARWMLKNMRRSDKNLENVIR